MVHTVVGVTGARVVVVTGGRVVVATGATVVVATGGVVVATGGAVVAVVAALVVVTAPEFEPVWRAGALVVAVDPAGVRVEPVERDPAVVDEPAGVVDVTPEPDVVAVVPAEPVEVVVTPELELAELAVALEATCAALAM